MTWEQTIEYIRTVPEYEVLVEKAYFGADLKKNVENFRQSGEYKESLRLIRTYQPNAKRILDIGCGNGISSVALALDGYEVMAVEPDPSNTVGAGAVRQLKEAYQLDKLEVQQDFAENLHLPSDHFDVVYFRQAMHHAHDLVQFLKESARVLKPQGLLLTIRDHVVFDDRDKELFLETHPLQKFYGGENAFSPSEYRAAMENAGLVIKEELKFFDSVINYFPLGGNEIKNVCRSLVLNPKVGFLWRLGPLVDMYVRLTDGQAISQTAERKLPGRMYSYVCIKN